jgi:FKBP-type peptidyl-prolyl cis-trans isomerase FkpA
MAMMFSRGFRRRSVVAIAAFVLAGTGCAPSITAPSGSAAASQTDVSIGTGPLTQQGNTLGVLYTGWLYDSTAPDHKGPQFDASGNNVFLFQLGGTTVISGWNDGLVGMRAGGERVLVIPPSLGYGATRHGSIPPNATLLFDIHLVVIQ